MKKILLLLAIVLPLVFAGCSKDEGQKSVTSIKFDDPTVSMKVGDNKKLSLTYLPQDAIAPNYVFESENRDIATVDVDGKVIGVSVGETTITAYLSNNSAIKTSCKIIIGHIEPTKISLSSNDLNINIGDTKKLSYTITPANATLNNVKWSSTDNDVVSVDNNGNITAKSVGNAKVKVEVQNSDVQDICDVVVLPIPSTGINLEIEGIDLVGSFVRGNILVSKELLVQAIVLPENATNKEVVFESSDNSILEVSKHNNIHKITPKKVGLAIITAKTADGITATSELTVHDIDHFATIGMSTKFVFDAFGQHIYLKIHFDTNKDQYVAIKDIKIFDANGNEPFNFTGFPLERKTYTVENMPISSANINGWKAEIHFSWKGKDYIIRSK